MRVHKSFPSFFASIIVILFAPVLLLSQIEVDNDDLQSWNDLQTTTHITKKLDLNTITTIQFGKNLTNIDNTRFAVGVTAKPIKHIYITPLFMVMSDRNSANRFRYEYRLMLRGVYKYEFNSLTLSHRSQVEYRYRPGRNTWRYRPSITFEKKLPESFVPGLKVFATEEVFYDSGAGRFSRNRLSAGINKVLNKRLSVDIYFLNQGDNNSAPGSVNVIGTAFKLAL